MASADEDGDGLSAFLEFASGSSDRVFNAGPRLTRDSFGHLLCTYQRRLGTDGILLEGEVSGDLTNWMPLEDSFILVGESGDGVGLRTLVWRSTVPDNGGKAFFRLRASER